MGTMQDFDKPGPAIAAKMPQLQESYNLLMDEISQLEIVTDDILARIIPVCNPVGLEENVPFTTEQARPKNDEVAVMRKARMAESIDNLRERVAFLANRIRIYRDNLEV